MNFNIFDYSGANSSWAYNDFESRHMRLNIGYFVFVTLLPIDSSQIGVLFDGLKKANVQKHQLIPLPLQLRV